MNFINYITTLTKSLESNFLSSIDLVNNQLLRPDLDFKNPLDRYDAEEYGMSAIELDKDTLLFSIVDEKSKLLDGTSFNLTVAAVLELMKFQGLMMLVMNTLKEYCILLTGLQCLFWLQKSIPVLITLQSLSILCQK